MDSYDIFRKLSQGAKFKRKSSANKPCDSKKLKLEPDIKIKEEPRDVADQRVVVDEHNDVEVTLLGSIVANESGNKKKKNKNKVFDDKKLSMLKQEEVNRFRNKHNINVVGRHIPEPFLDFQQLPIANDLIENLAKCGYKEPTPIQNQAIPIMLNHRQILACAPTGSGKTAAFLIPLLHHLQEPQKKGFRAVVVCPTRELAKQTQRECARLGEGRGFRIHVISKIKQGLTQYGPKSNQKFDILVTTPNRLCFLLNQDPPAISLTNVEWLIIDEADKLFEDGLRGFRNQLDQIITSCKSEKLHIAMFSATQTADVGQWCKKNIKGLINVTVGKRNAATELVDQELLFVGNENGKLVAFRNLLQKGLAPPVLVFIQSKERAQQLFSELIYDGINVDAIHADRTQLQRDNTVKSFREGKIWVLICTELMARGVDFKGVNLVINYDFPPSAIAYIHRVGRAGRAGRKGKAITFFTLNDTPNMRSIAHVLRQSGCEVPEYMLAMKKQSKKERNKVIERDDITTKPKYVLEKNEKKRNLYVKPLPTKEKRNIGKELEMTDEKTKFLGRKTNNRNVAKKMGPSKHKLDKNKKFAKNKSVSNM